MRDTMHGRVLESAAVLLGGEAALASHLAISIARLRLYLNGTAACPPATARKVAAMLLAQEPKR